MQNRFKRGFTIIELIVVITIIAVLAGIVLVNVQGYTNKAKNSAVKAGADQFIKKGFLYFTENPASSSSVFFSGEGSVAFATIKKSTVNNNIFSTYSSATAQWAACTQLYATSESACAGYDYCYFCFDYTGAKKIKGYAFDNDCSNHMSSYIVGFNCI